FCPSLAPAPSQPCSVSLHDALPICGEMVVDFCAGAGGKTLAIGASMRNTGRLYAFDTSGHRLDALKPRLARSGLSNVHPVAIAQDRKSTRLNSSHEWISYAVFCLK